MRKLLFSLLLLLNAGCAHAGVVIDNMEYATNASAATAYPGIPAGYGANVFTGGSATQRNTYGDDETSYGAANAFDNDTATRQASKQNEGLPYWIIYDLGASVYKQVQQLGLNYYDGCVQNISLLGSNDSSSWVYLYNNTAIVNAHNTWQYFNFTNNNTYRYYNLTVNEPRPADKLTSIFEISGSETIATDTGVYSEPTIKTEGSYSIRVAVNTTQNGTVLSHTVSPAVNLSGVNDIQFDIYSNRTGENIKVMIRNPPENCDVPVNDSDHVKTTTQYDVGYAGYYATGNNTVIGNWFNGAWLSGGTNLTDQRFSIDLGSAKIVNQIHYENLHYIGDHSASGIKNFTFWGSNLSDSFNQTDYANDTGWTQIDTVNTTFIQHAASDTAEPRNITANNTVAYQYYSFKFNDSYGGSFFGVRRLWLQKTTVDITNTPNITSTGTWQNVPWNISSVADSDKNAIGNVMVTIMNADANNTFYLDNFNSNISAGGSDWQIF